MPQIDHKPRELFSVEGDRLHVSDAPTLRSQRIDSSLRATFTDFRLRLKHGQVAQPICAAVIEFDAMDRLTFATREAQQMLAFTQRPLWGQSLTTALQRVPQPLEWAEWLIPAAQASTATTRALGQVDGWLRLGISNQAVLTICFRDR